MQMFLLTVFCNNCFIEFQTVKEFNKLWSVSTTLPKAWYVQLYFPNKTVVAQASEIFETDIRSDLQKDTKFRLERNAVKAENKNIKK